MIKATKEMVLGTTITGSLPRPGWYTANLAGRPFRLAMADIVFREQYNDAVSCFLRDQERAGLDILTDGDCRVDTDVGGRAGVTYPAQRIRGMTGYDHTTRHTNWGGTVPGELLFELLAARMLPIVPDKVGRGPLEYGPRWKTAQKMTHKPVKFGAITAECIESTCGNEYYKDRKELIMDLAAVINEEVLDLAKSSCPVVQMEEPWVHRAEQHEDDEGIGIDFYVEAFNRSVRPFRDFMMSHVREQDLGLFVDIGKIPEEEARREMPMRVLIPAFMISELRRAFEIGFLVFVPFLIIDMVAEAKIGQEKANCSGCVIS